MSEASGSTGRTHAREETLTMDRTKEDRIPNEPTRLASLIAVALIIGVGLSQAFQDFRSDDWRYLRWARTHPGFINAFVGQRPFHNIRPLSDATWQFQALFGASLWPAEIVVLGLWGIALLAFFRVVVRRAGPWAGISALVLALSIHNLRALPNWRSWVSTAGDMAGVWVAVWIADSQRNSDSRAVPIRAMVALAMGAGFKEVTWFYGALGMLAIGRWRLALPAAVAFLVHSWISPFVRGGGVSIHHFLSNLPVWLGLLWQWTWPVPLALASLFAPSSPNRRPHFIWMAAGCVAVLPALSYDFRNPTYYVESSLFLLMGLVPLATEALRRRPRAALAFTVGLAVLLLRPSMWQDYTGNVPWQYYRLRTARQLVVDALDQHAVRVWAEQDDNVSPCGLAAALLEYDHGVSRATERIAGAVVVGRCLEIEVAGQR
jgi:hypothetical protein